MVLKHNIDCRIADAVGRSSREIIKHCVNAIWQTGVKHIHFAPEKLVGSSRAASAKARTDEKLTIRRGRSPASMKLRQSPAPQMSFFSSGVFCGCDTGRAEVCESQVTHIFGNEHIVAFQVTVNDLTLVQVLDGRQELAEERLSLIFG